MKVPALALRGIANFTRSKKPVLVQPFIHRRRSSQWISATSTKNYILDDALVDILKSKKAVNRSYKRVDTLDSYLAQKGIEFENGVVEYISKNKVDVVSISEVINDDTVRLTEHHMMLGTPVIHSAPLRNKKNRTHGVADLLVRSDYLRRIVECNPLTEKEESIHSPKMCGPYHYVVVDIKFSTLPLRADGRHILNSSNYKAYKTQLYIYNECVASIQGYKPRYAFILGRRWSYKSCGVTYNGLNCLDRLGVVDFHSKDLEYVEKSKKAVKWVKEVRKNGRKWSVSPPSREELYPNMSITSGDHHDKKQKIAFDLGEISMLWFCGVKQRLNGFKKGIYSWRDKGCTADALGVKGSRARVIDDMISINTQDSDFIRPKKVVSDTHDWRLARNEVYVDFETIIDVVAKVEDIPEQKRTDMIFMIGVSYTMDGSPAYRSFIAREASHQAELEVMTSFQSFMKLLGYPKMWYWCAERRFWNIAKSRHSMLEDELEDGWYDLSDLFREEPIVVRGCFGFGLKNIAKNMRKYNLINTSISSSCDNGGKAMIQALRAYETDNEPAKSEIMKDIEVYNRFDCDVLMEILDYLRKNH